LSLAAVSTVRVTCSVGCVLGTPVDMDGRGVEGDLDGIDVEQLRHAVEVAEWMFWPARISKRLHLVRVGGEHDRARPARLVVPVDDGRGCSYGLRQGNAGAHAQVGLDSQDVRVVIGVRGDDAPWPFAGPGVHDVLL